MARPRILHKLYLTAFWGLVALGAPLAVGTGVVSLHDWLVVRSDFQCLELAAPRPHLPLAKQLHGCNMHSDGLVLPDDWKDAVAAAVETTPAVQPGQSSSGWRSRATRVPPTDAELGSIPGEPASPADWDLSQLRSTRAWSSGSVLGQDVRLAYAVGAPLWLFPAALLALARRWVLWLMRPEADAAPGSQV